MSSLVGPEPLAGPTPHQRFKEGFRTRLWLSFLIASALHLALFEAWPTMEAVVAVEPPSQPVVVHQILDPIPLPPERPRNPVRPASPIVGATAAPTSTVPVLDFESAVPPLRPVPPQGVGNPAPPAAIFQPFTVGPQLLNPSEVQRALELAYPPLLREAELGGTVVLTLFVDAGGSVTEARVETSSGYRSMDEAALDIVPTMNFRAALNYDKAVGVWIRLPVEFKTRSRALG